ncbi:hypothetical protein M378DRAFT_972480 [Amanita muscaria Koide BX008]|uniref:Uncharacterized protein n=1 Tax=Amanita muscaria (strain Koide BX008) TaxID=946122 RepID=A0A0C2XFR9_AMAMK|nr:hypothetical protein M378DRAFT_972480 [Amanita muscaria Koide BX008]
MALTLTATIPGPSWDEEVVPALRKRLQIESRTLSRRLSGLSLINGDNLIGQPFSTLPNASTYEDTPQHVRIEDNYQRIGYQPPGPSTFGSSSARVNGAIKPKPVRNRTISQPYTPDSMRSKRKPSTSRSPNGTSRPTRIPKVSRTTPTSSPHNSPALNHVNGFGQLAIRTSGSINGVPSDSLTSRDYANTSLTDLGEMGRRGSGLLDEPPPFPMASISSSRYEALNETPSRRSNDSEERPFEHWYRGEISRNGGVGELRVGKRQEMLDIANYGHKLAQRQREAMARTNRATTVDDGRWRRKRAGSVGEIGRSPRDSVYLDEEDTQEMGRVLDESPPTDLDGEGDDFFDVQSADDHHVPSTQQRYDAAYAYTHVGDSSTASEPPLRSSPESRSSTPTPAVLNTPTIQQYNGRSAIQSSSSPRSSPEPRAVTPVEMRRGASEPPSSSRSTPSTPRAQRHQVKDTATPASAQKRAVSPTAKAKPSPAKRTNLSKPKKQMTKEEKRRSVAVYPLTAGDGDMADAIPSWTQPKLKEGNWDEVVLPVVARKKGLDDQYEQADGSPQPKRVEKMMIEPAPGTFGIKFRAPSSPENIPMDEFGVTMNDATEVISAEDKQDSEPAHSDPIAVEYDDIPLPVRHQPPPSPVPFADYIPAKPAGTSTTTQPPRPAIDDRPTQRQDDKDSAGCCQCVIM